MKLSSNFFCRRPNCHFCTTQQFSVDQTSDKSLGGVFKKYLMVATKSLLHLQSHSVNQSIVKVLRHFESLISHICGVLTEELETKIDWDMSSEIFLGEISSNTEQLCGKFHLKLHAFVGNNADKIVHFCIVMCVLPWTDNINRI